jgi:hypothetical protein
MAQGFALIMTWPIVSPPFLAGLLAARNRHILLSAKGGGT